MIDDCEICGHRIDRCLHLEFVVLPHCRDTLLGPDDDLLDDKFTRFRRSASEVQAGAWPKVFAVVGLVIVVAIAGSVLQRSGGSREFVTEDEKLLVLYCAHDLPFVEPLIAAFENDTGIRVTIVADTEANKSLGLTRRLMAERKRPQADVFWNNQLLGTIDLARQGVFQSHASVTERDRFELRDKDEAGLWTAFGARLRVWIINEESNETWPDERVATQLPDDPNFCVADPLFGTTLTHATILWKQEGREAFTSWFKSLPRKGVRVVPGNSATRDLVADGVCRDGWTDTDDFFGAIERKAAVRMEPVRTASGQTIAIPNSVAIIKDCPHPTAAKVFIGWLLSETTERQLADGPAAQVPLGRLDDPSTLPERVRDLIPAVQEAIDLRSYVDARQEVLKFLSGRDR